MLRFLAAALVVAGLHGLCVDAQNLPAPTGSVQGHVIYADTQQPARLAHVVLQPMVDLHSPVLTSNGEHHSEGLFHLQTVGLDGSFVIANVPQGLYYVIAEQDGYVSPLTLFTREQLNQPSEILLRRIAQYMTSISVTAGHTTQAEVRLVRGAVIAGKVLFEDGSPAVGVGMALLQREENGQWKTVRLGGLASHSNFHTDDQGQYRFSGLPGGEYLVRASVELNNVILDHIFSSNGATSYGDGYHLQIYPGDAFRTRDAKPVKVEEGELASAVDVDVPLSKLYSLSGTALHPNGASPVNAARVTLMFADTADELNSTEVSSDDGTFRFDFVPGGKYTMQVSHIGDVQRTEVPNCEHCVPPTHTETKVIRNYGDASLPIELTGDQSGVVVHAKPVTKAEAAGQNSPTAPSVSTAGATSY